jgi:hypothetical protein
MPVLLKWLKYIFVFYAVALGGAFAMSLLRFL